MQNMEARCRKAYVCVNLDVDKEGAIRPRFIRWDNGLIFRSTRFFTNAAPHPRRLVVAASVTQS